MNHAKQVVKELEKSMEGLDVKDEKYLRLSLAKEAVFCAVDISRLASEGDLDSALKRLHEFEAKKKKINGTHIVSNFANGGVLNDNKIEEE